MASGVQPPHPGVQPPPPGVQPPHLGVHPLHPPSEGWGEASRRSGHRPCRLRRSLGRVVRQSSGARRRRLRATSTAAHCSSRRIPSVPAATPLQGPARSWPCAHPARWVACPLRAAQLVESSVAARRWGGQQGQGGGRPLAAGTDHAPPQASRRGWSLASGSQSCCSLGLGWGPCRGVGRRRCHSSLRAVPR